MKIPGKDPGFLLEKTVLGASTRVHTGKKSEGSQRSESDQSTSAHQVDISEKAKTLQKLTHMASTQTDTRSERIEQIRYKIASGTYQPEAKQIAEKIVRSTLLDNIL